MKCHAMGTGQEHGRARFDLSPSPFMLNNSANGRPNVLEANVFSMFPVYVNESLCFGSGRHRCEQFKFP